MPFYSLNSDPEVALHYDIVEGIAPVDLFFIHGNLASNRWWHPTIELLKGQSSGKDWKGRAVFAEFRGCGQSTPPKQFEDVNMTSFAQDFIGLVRHLVMSKVILVGHSTGGLIASLMLSRAPELFQGGLFLDPVGVRGVTFDPSMIQAFEKMKTDKELVAVVLGSTIYGLQSQDPFFRNVLLEDGFHAVRHVGHWVIQALDGLNIEKEVSQIPHPVLVLHGEHDQLLPRGDSEEFARRLAKGEFQVIPGQGHCVNVENPALFVSILLKFAQGFTKS